jgi:pyruvate dehydrogenase E1 component beta subunit
MAIIGAAVGAAVNGLRPVVEIMFAEFYGVALDQIVTQAAKLHYLTYGQVTVPLVTRGSVGAGRGFGATHSQTCETWFLATSGLKIVHVSTPQNAYGLLRSAIRDDNPVVFLEPRVLYGDRAEVMTGEAGIIPLGQAHIARQGSDVTIVSLGQMVHVALAAAQILADRQIDAEVIDLQTLRPWDRFTVMSSAARTRRLVVVEENPMTGGWGTEIAAAVGAELFGQLSAPVHRVTTPDVPVPFNKKLEFTYLPSAVIVASQIAALCETGARPISWWEALV